MIQRLTLASMFALAVATTLPGCGGAGEACNSCHFEGAAGSPGTAGTGVTGLGGRGGSGSTSGNGGTGGSAAGAGAGGTGAGGTAGVVGTAGTSGTSGAAGKGGTSGTAGTAGRGGASGTAGTSGTSGSGGSAGSGTAGTSGTSGTVGTGGTVGTAGSGGTGSGGTAGTGTGGGGSGGSAGSAGTGGSAGSAGSAGTTGGTGGSAGSGGAAGTIGSGMVVWYKFDETSGLAAADSSGNNRNGTVTPVGGGTGTFSTTHQVGTRAISLNGTSSTVGAYVNVPDSLNGMGATTAVTIACWVNVTTARNWQRVWDFNNTSTTGYMFLTTQEQVNMRVRFAISQTTNTAEQTITSATTLATGWHHIAVVLDVGAMYTGTLYIDGAVAGTTPMMTLRPSSIGDTANNFIGKSAYPDPYFAGLVDDFRVYNRALSASEMTMLYMFR